MFVRSCAKALLFAGLVLPFVGCGSSTAIDSIQVSPTTVSLGTGNTAQLTAIGTIGHGNHPSTSQNITATVNWASSIAAVATVSSTGMVTGVGAGTTTITASIEGFGGLVTSNATSVTVTGSGGGTGTAVLVSLAIIPGSQSVASPGQTSQFIAIGTTSSGATEDLTGQVAWSSSSASIAKISSSGLATGVSQGTTTITAIATNPDKTVVTGTATFTVVGGTAEQITSLTVYPGSQAATAQAQQSQFFVLGTQGSGGLQYDETSQVAWTSSNEAVATIGTTGNGTPGLATAVGTGTTTITTTFTNTDGSKVVANATYSVTIGAAQEPLLSITIVPGGITVSNKGMTGQFLAFGTYSTTPTVRDLTNQVTWISLLPEVASIESGGVAGEVGGLATAQGYTGFSDIYAEMLNPDGTVVLSNAETFTCLDPSTQNCNQAVAHPQLATLTVYNSGENTTTWLVTAPSDTGTPNLIHCGPGSTTGGSVCTGTYETGSTVVLTESPTGSGFGGWSSGDGVAGVGCMPAPGKTLLNSPTCTVTLTGDTSVGAIFY
jgi:Bacterial Ig-like domain (group 2)